MSNLVQSEVTADCQKASPNDQDTETETNEFRFTGEIVFMFCRTSWLVYWNCYILCIRTEVQTCIRGTWPPSVWLWRHYGVHIDGLSCVGWVSLKRHEKCLQNFKILVIQIKEKGSLWIPKRKWRYNIKTNHKDRIYHALSSSDWGHGPVLWTEKWAFSFRYRRRIPLAAVPIIIIIIIKNWTELSSSAESSSSSSSKCRLSFIVPYHFARCDSHTLHLMWNNVFEWFNYIIPKIWTFFHKIFTRYSEDKVVTSCRGTKLTFMTVFLFGICLSYLVHYGNVWKINSLHVPRVYNTLATPDTGTTRRLVVSTTDLVEMEHRVIMK
jgi:hypothetical protein